MQRKKYGHPLLDTPPASYKVRMRRAKDKEAEKQAIEKDLFEREAALYALFGTERPKRLDIETRLLIHRMAATLKIPGFMARHVIKNSGRPTKWNCLNIIALLKQMESVLLEKDDISILNAAQIVKTRYGRTETARNLKKRYEEYRKTNLVTVKRLYERLENAKSIEEKRQILKKFPRPVMAENMN